MARPLKYDIVGCGAAVQHHHLSVLRTLHRQGSVSIGGCFDLDPANADRVAAELEAEQQGVHPSPTEGDGVDAVLIATPPSSHANLAEAYIRAGKHVLVEKPFVTTLDEAEELLEAARDRGVALLVNHYWRFFPAVEIARSLLAGGEVDRIRRVEATEGARWGWTPSSDYVTQDPFGGVIHDSASHLLDMVLFILGLDDVDGGASFEVDRLVRTPAREPSHECRARAALKTSEAEPIEIDLGVSRLTPLACAVKVWGSTGLLVVPTTFASTPILFRGDASFRIGGTGRAEAKAEDECFMLGHRELLKAARTGAPTRLSADRFLLLADALESLWSAGQ